MTSPTIYYFPNIHRATLAEVGGKGLSLIQGSQAGLPVPSGFILSASFFQPWFQELQKLESWKTFTRPDKYDLKKSSIFLKEQVQKLPFTIEQKHELLESLQKYSAETLFAVRSSSPEEDLEGASFAGGYETVLGVKTNNIEHAIRKAFASCLDYRVTIYKQEHGFNIADPKIAVIIQEQIPSEVAGVGFSINPITNNYDEAIISANFGLGETVVQGITTPDTFTISKVTTEILNKQLGTKETSIWLLPNGGTKEKKSGRNNQFTLSDKQIHELILLIMHVESFYKKPLDVEWAYANDKLYLLQARPITGFVPLSSELVTKSGERKRLYLNLTISVQGITHPVSVMATSFFKTLLKIVGKEFFNRDLSKNVNATPAIISEGQMYLNLSFLLLFLGRKHLLSFLHLFDPLAQKALTEIETNQYLAQVHKISLLPWKLSLKLPQIAIRILKARSHPVQIHKQTQQELYQFVAKANFIAEQDLPINILATQLIEALLSQVFLKTVPLFIMASSTRSKLKKIAGEENKDLFSKFDKALPHNITTEMGLALFHVSQVLPTNLTQERLLEGLQEENLPKPFLTTWEDFIQTYGFRGPEEIDIAAPRYHENPEMLLDTLLTLKKSGENTQDEFDANQKRRRQAYEALYQKLLSKNQKEADRFSRLYSFYETFAGYREAHKYYAALVVDLVRQRVLKNAKILYEKKRLDSVQQVFDLTLEQLDAGMKDTSIDLKELAKTNKVFINKLSKISHLPSLIDSRGLIIKPHMEPINRDKIIGMPVSPGTARGRIKILHNPSEKPFLKGDVLVARATDPGWTPLFVNASAVILEIGGMLQHGALVAREYGLPCVTGIENATTLWKDGTVVEVDGSEGIVRVIKNA